MISNELSNFSKLPTFIQPSRHSRHFRTTPLSQLNRLFTKCLGRWVCLLQNSTLTLQNHVITVTWKKSGQHLSHTYTQHVSHLGNHMDVSENSGFSPQIIHCNRVFHYFHHPFWEFSPSFWKHPYINNEVFFRRTLGILKNSVCQETPVKRAKKLYPWQLAGGVWLF